MLGLVVLAELTALFFLAQHTTQLLYRLLLAMVRHRAAAVALVTLIHFPGTVVHELAHLFTAEILGVRTGKLSLAPESIQDDIVQAGSVMIAQSGPLRRTLIGIAPTTVGLIAITFLSYLLYHPEILPIPSAVISLFSYRFSLIAFLVFYLLFAVSNNMFPSAIDLRGTPAVGITLVLLLAAAYIAGFRLSLTGQALELANQVVTSLVQSLGIVLAINGVLVLIVSVLIVLTQKITKK